MLMLALFLILLDSVTSQEIRIPAYRNSTAYNPGNPPSVVYRIIKPGQSRQTQVFRPKPIIRIQPLLIKPHSVRQEPTLVSILSEMGLRIMASQIQRAQIENDLENAGNITLFAPTDEAFSLVSPPSDQNRLRNFLLQHVVRSRILPEDIRNDVTLPSLNNAFTPLRFNVYENGQMVCVSGSQFLDDARDYHSIRIQPIDRVLFPISNENLVTEVRLTFPKLYKYLMDSSFTQQLNSGTFSLFAPTDDAFDFLPEEVRQKLEENPSFLRKVLLNHVAPGTHYSAVLSHGYELKTLGGDPIHFTNRRGLILANGTPVVKSDISVNNGVIHALNRLLLPPELTSKRKYVTIVPPSESTTTPEVSLSDSNLPVTTYIEPPPPVPRAITKAMVMPLHLPNGRNVTFSTANSLFRRSLLLATLKNNGDNKTYTIIMPSDGAYNALGQEALDRIRRDSRLLRRMLRCQMIEGSVNLSHRTRADTPLRSLGGTIILSSLNNGQSFMIGGSPVLSVRPASNGMVFVTDRVSYPPAASNVVASLEPFQFKNVVNKQPNMQQILSSGDSPYTVFAPTDKALSVLPREQLQDPDFARRLIQAHTVLGAYYRSRLTPGLQLTTLGGTIININHTPTGQLSANNVPLYRSEILSGNGVTHPIDELLFYPPSTDTSPTTSHPTESTTGELLHPVPQDDSHLTPSENDFRSIAHQLQASIFMDILRSTGLYRTLLQSGQNPCTIYAPTDSSLSAIEPSLLKNRKFLVDFVRAHTVLGLRRSVLLPAGLTIRTLHGNTLKVVRTENGDVFLNDAPLTGKEYLVGNGILVGVRKILYVPKTPSLSPSESTIEPETGYDFFDATTITEDEGGLITSSKEPDTNKFVQLVRNIGLKKILGDSEEKGCTIFAPNDAAMDSITPEKLNDENFINELVRFHIFRGAYHRHMLVDGLKITTLAGDDITVRRTSNDLFANEVPFDGDEGLENGCVVYPMANVLFTPDITSSPVTESSTTKLFSQQDETRLGTTFSYFEEPFQEELRNIAEKNNATEFLHWMKKAEQNRILEICATKYGGCTLFLPTNDAIKRMSSTLRSVITSDPKLLRKFIQFHTCPLTMDWSKATDNSLLPSILEGRKIRINIYHKQKEPAVLTAMGCRVSSLRPLQSNKKIVVAIIDDVMIPARSDIVKTLATVPFLGNFTKIFTVAGGRELLSDGEPYTIFAPNGCGFSMMNGTTYQQLISSKKLARDFIKRHIVRGYFYTSGLEDGQRLNTEYGTTLIFRITPDCIYVSNIRILHGDYSCKNVVLHIIEKAFPV